MKHASHFRQLLRQTGLAVFLGFAGFTSSQAATLFYGGDADGGSGINVQAAMYYDDFSLSSASDVGAIWGNFVYTGLVAETAYYEIRTGITVGNSGTLIASGSGAAIVTLTGRSFFGDPENRVAVNVSLALDPGTYWVGLTPYGADIGLLGLMTTSGQDLGPGIDPNPVPTGATVANGNGFFNPTYANSLSITGDGRNFSYGLSTTPIPEPGIMVFLLSGGILFHFQTCRRRIRE